LLMAICFCNLANAELTLQINGPSIGNTGDLIVINSIGSNAKVKNWIVPDELANKSMTCTDQLGFSTSVPGSYTFYLYGTDGEQITHTSHTIVITKSGEIPEDPLPPPTGNFDSLTKSSRDLSMGLNDAKVRKKIGDELIKFKTVNDSLADSQADVERIITSVLAQRSRSEADANWLEGWYVPMLKQIAELARLGMIKNTNQYQAAIKAIALGLNQ